MTQLIYNEHYVYCDENTFQIQEFKIGSTELQYCMC